MTPEYKLFDISSYVFARDDKKNEDKYRFQWKARIGFCVKGEDSDAEWQFLKHKDTLPSFTFYSRETKPGLEDWPTGSDGGSTDFDVQLILRNFFEVKEDVDGTSRTVKYEARLLVVQVQISVDGKKKKFEYMFDLWRGQHRDTEIRKENCIEQGWYRLHEAMAIRPEEDLECDLRPVTPNPGDFPLSSMKPFSGQEQSSFSCKYVQVIKNTATAEAKTD